MAIPNASAGCSTFFRMTAMSVPHATSNFWAETTNPVSTRAEPPAAVPITSRDLAAKEGKLHPAREKASPSRGNQTIVVLKEWMNERAMCPNAEPPPPSCRLASSIARVIGDTVIEPIASETATVTVEFEPKTEANNGSPTAATFGKLTVNATTELSDRDRPSAERDQRYPTTYRTT